jgi:hypothetical protein
MAIAAGSAVCPGAVSAGGLVIDSFTAVPDCIFPDPRRHILSYRVSGGILRVRLYAIHPGGRLREFYSQPAGGPSPLHAGTHNKNSSGQRNTLKMRAAGPDRDFAGKRGPVF